MSKSKGTSKKVIKDIAKGIQDVFKKYTRNTREKGWDVITSKEGEKQVKRLIIDPNINLNGFERLTFKEWLESTKEI